MIIYVLRHGHAETQITTDEERRLTDRGVLDTERVLTARAKELASIASIWVSPLVRAQQTARIAQKHCIVPSLQITNLLVPESDPQVLIEWLYSNLVAQSDAVLLVSHQPLVSRLLGLMCGKSEGLYPMGTSSLAAIDIQPIAAGLGKLLWLDHASH